MGLTGMSSLLYLPPVCFLDLSEGPGSSASYAPVQVLLKSVSPTDSPSTTPQTPPNPKPIANLHLPLRHDPIPHHKETLRPQSQEDQRFYRRHEREESVQRYRWEEGDERAE